MSRGSALRSTPRLHPKLAVALHYEPHQGAAPRVVATGRGLTALRIEEVARQAGVPVHQDSSLAEMLGDVPLQETIPEELFEAVARVIAFVWRVDARMNPES